jgi:hypothetical protein
MLTTLRLPDLLIILAASGREIQQRRHPDAEGDDIARQALVQMRELQLLPGHPPLVDASAAI